MVTVSVFELVILLLQAISGSRQLLQPVLVKSAEKKKRIQEAVLIKLAKIKYLN